MFPRHRKTLLECAARQVNLRPYSIEATEDDDIANDLAVLKMNAGFPEKFDKVASGLGGEPDHSRP